MPVKLTPRFAKAVAYASKAHAKQKRKGTDMPYIGHLLGVASIALEYGASETEAIGAILHDVVEDCGGKPRLKDVRRRFGRKVAEIVDGCTDSDSTPKPPWRGRKEAYIKHLPKVSASARLVSAADKLYNTRAILNDYRRIGDRVWERFKSGKSGALWYYRALVIAFRKLDSGPLIDELDRVVTTLENVVGGAASQT